MDSVIDRLLFGNGFPSLETRAIWNRRYLINACASFEPSAGSGRYHQLLRRIKHDVDYVKVLAKLVSIYASGW
jgi:hypothetical protein